MREDQNLVPSALSDSAQPPRSLAWPKARSVAASDSTVSPTWHSTQRQLVIQWLRQQVPTPRLEHSLRVEQLAYELAQHHGVEPELAAQAGLMHDLAKCFKPARLLELAQAHGVTIDSVYAANPHLLHAEVGAIVARAEFGIQNEAILQAIRHHTLGCPGMSPLSCVIFLADSLEPGRGDTPALNELRQLSQCDLYRAVRRVSEYSIQQLFASHSLIHPQAIMTRNWATQLTPKSRLEV